jgi:hypothetical protein
MTVWGGVHLFPVRHHSPRTSAVLRRFLDALKPKVVLVEGPSDANPLISAITDPETRPPVAILGYRTDGTPGSSLWPFASYSPEYVALAWAREHDAEARFIDLTIGQALAAERPGPVILDEEEPAEGAQGDQGQATPAPSLYQQCAEARGFRSFEEFWEASFEAPDYDADSFRAALLAYADLVRAEGDRSFHRAREAYMTRQLNETIAKGFAPSSVAVIVGAAHAAAFVAGDVDPALEALLAPTVASASTVIPYSFPRLAEQLGYGAGNRAPQYYQRAHDAGCDFRRATLEVLVEFTDHLRLRGFAASLADTIEAYRLAMMLSQLRGKAEPGLDELREASIATLCRGDGRHLDTFLWPSVIGRAVGRVASSVGRNSLQEEFWREVRTRRLPESDSPESFTLHLTNEVEVGSSVFLHRLRVAGVPYAGYVGAQRTGGASSGEAAGGHAALSRVREVWEAQWTPSTDVALVEKIVLGDSLGDVVTRTLEARLAGVNSTGAAADVLLESVVTACAQTTSSALAACDRFAANDDDLPSLAGACRALSGLVAYGSSRAHSAIGDEAIAPLCVKTFDRAVLRVTDACTGTDEAVAPARDALRTLHELAMSQPLLDKQAWITAAHTLSVSYAVNASASGLACALLYLAQALTEADVARLVGQRLSNTLEPLAAASFLEGFLQASSLVLVKSRPVVKALDEFLCSIDTERFADLLPILRRALASLGPTERRYLLENLVAVRGLGQDARAVQAVIAEQDKEKLKELSSELDDLDDLL